MIREYGSIFGSPPPRASFTQSVRKGLMKNASFFFLSSKALALYVRI